MMVVKKKLQILLKKKLKLIRQTQMEEKKAKQKLKTPMLKLAKVVSH